MKEFILDVAPGNHIGQMMTKFAALDMIAHFSRDNMRISFKKAAYITPATAVIILAIRDELAKVGKRIYFSPYELRDNPALVDFFLKSGLYNAIPKQSQMAVHDAHSYSKRRANTSPFFIHTIDLDYLRQKGAAFASDNLVREAMKAVDVLGLINDNSKAILISKIMELLNNSFCHSRSSVAYLMVAQDKDDGYLLSVYDRGIGIPGSYDEYSSAHHLTALSDEEAIKWSLQRGNSTLQDSGDFPRGVGLYTIFELMDSYHGWMSIASRNGAYTYKDGAAETLHMPLSLTGTMLLLHIPSTITS